ncbi:MAG: alkaline phosphatase family protein [Mangrovibacterium sp.]|nr:alkaline phosphatase family protein [Mangrovibacterium sp.]
MRSLNLAGCLFVFFTVCFRAYSQQPANLPKLVVVINVEQMRSDYLSRYAGKFQKDGFMKLLREGAVCSRATMNLHVLKPLTGVATLFTGVYPDRHGIIAGSWYDRLKEKEIHALNDPDCLTVGSDSKEGQRSSARLLSSTVGDALKLSTGNKAKVYSVALNDYSAVFSAGHAADGAYWMDNQTGNMISSSFFVSHFPGWAFNFNNKKLAGYYGKQEWSTLLLPSSYEESWQDDHRLEKGYFGKWRTFPYRLNQLISETGNYKLLKTTPFGNTIVNEFAMALIHAEQLGKDDIPDLLAVSFSSMDYENASFGPLSVEMEDTYLRLDKEISLLLGHLEKEVGLAHTLIVLTSACSSSYPVDYLKEEFRMPAGYVAPESMIALLKSFLNITYGQGDWVVYAGDQQIYLNRALLEKKNLKPEDVQEKAAAFINQFEGVKLALPATDIERGDYVKSQFVTISRSFNLKRSGDVMYMLEDGWQPQYKFQQSSFTDHSQIPLVWMGGAVKDIRNRAPVDAIDIVPTIFEILRLDPPYPFEGKIIEEIL